MASIVFSSMGQAIGGPFGALSGAITGSAIDTLLFSRRRPSMVDRIQRSAYGVIFPRVFGVVRAAGIVIWAHVSDQGAKGSGERSGTASIAVAVSSRGIRSIRRIWADGREIRNLSGEFVSPTIMRTYDGTQTEADPVIVAVEGLERAPCFAGLAYVVFDNLALEAYGNRIPNLSFEVEADEGGVDDWLAELGGWRVYRDPSHAASWVTTGYVASSATIGTDVEALMALASTGVRDIGGSLSFSDDGEKHLITREDVCVGNDGVQGFQRERAIAVSKMPSRTTVGYLDTARDYQEGMQCAVRQRRGSEAQILVPASLTASDARAFARYAMEQAELEADSLSVMLSWKWLNIAVGDIIQFTGEAEEWRVVERAVRGLMVHVQAVRHMRGARGQAQAEAGRSMVSPAVAIPETRLQIFEIPFPLDNGQSGLMVSANGGPGWRGAEIGILSDSGTARMGAVQARRPCGRLLSELASASALVWDEKNAVTIALSDPDSVLESRADIAVLAGANLLRIGEELLQFRLANSLGQGQYRVSGFLRGRYGTAPQNHVAGDLVEMITMDGLVTMPVNEDMAGRPIVVVAQGRGDPPGGKTVEHVVQHIGGQQLAPVHFRCERLSDGTIVSSWVAVDGRMSAWGSPEVEWRGGTWRLIGDDGARYEVPVKNDQLRLSIAEQVDLSGAPFPPGHAYVVVDGEAAEELRASRAVKI